MKYDETYYEIYLENNNGTAYRRSVHKDIESVFKSIKPFAKTVSYFIVECKVLQHHKGEI
jgi:hypothetical protein